MMASAFSRKLAANHIDLGWGDASMVGSLLSFGFGGFSSAQELFHLNPLLSCGQMPEYPRWIYQNRQGDAPALVVLAG